MIKNILNLNYWFDLKPLYFSDKSEKLFLIILLLLLIIGIITFIKKQKKGFYRGLYKKIYTFSSSSFIIGLLILFLRYERATFLSARFWMGLWFIYMIIYILYLINALKKIPDSISKFKEEEEKKKYLP